MSHTRFVAQDIPPGAWAAFAFHLEGCPGGAGPEPQARALICLRLDARNKVTLDDGRSDRELFGRMPTGDLWDDAEMQSIYLYLLESSKTIIPDSWRDVMMEFTREVKRSLPRADLIEEHNSMQNRKRCRADDGV